MDAALIDDVERSVSSMVERRHSRYPYFGCALLALGMVAIYVGGNRDVIVTSTLSEAWSPPSHASLKELMNYCGIDPQSAPPPIPAFDEKHYDLVLVQAFIRHGDRMFYQGKQCWPGQENMTYHCNMTRMSMPGTRLSLDSIQAPDRIFRQRYMHNRNNFKGNCRIGQLTYKGYLQERANGAVFRRAYAHALLKPHMEPSEVYLRSVDQERTIQSLEAFMAGLYPTGDNANCRTDVADIWMMDLDRETELGNAHNCPGLNAQNAKAYSSPGFLNYYSTVIVPLKEKIANVLHMPARAIDLYRISDCVSVSMCRGDPVPEGFTLQLLSEMEQSNRFTYYYGLQYPDRVNGSRLTSGPLLGEILERMERTKRREPGAPLFSIYSGHDTGPIMLLLSSLNIDDGFWPPYASYISFELYQKKTGKPADREYSVRIIYNGKVRRLPISPGADLTSFDAFKQMLLPMIPTREECPGAFAS